MFFLYVGMKPLAPSFWKEKDQKDRLYNQEEKSKDSRNSVDVEFWPPGTHGTGKRTRSKICSNGRPYAKTYRKCNTDVS
jgi:hypothetical protein